jgi:hypothetical protein
MAYRVGRQRQARRVGARSAVAVLERDGAGYLADALGLQLGAGDDAQHARHGLRIRHVEGRDPRMRVRGAQDVSMRLAGQADVVGIAAMAQQRRGSSTRRTDWLRPNFAILELLERIACPII